MLGLDGKYKFSWKEVVYLIICIIGIVGLLLLLRMARREAANYDQPQSKEKTELKANPDIQIGAENKPQETGEANYKEQGRKQLYEQMRQTISPEVME